MIASGDVSTDPENLRFQYPVEETTSKPASTRKAPAVYKEQVEAYFQLPSCIYETGGVWKPLWKNHAACRRTSPQLMVLGHVVEVGACMLYFNW